MLDTPLGRAARADGVRPMSGLSGSHRERGAATSIVHVQIPGARGASLLLTRDGRDGGAVVTLVSGLSGSRWYETENLPP